MPRATRTTTQHPPEHAGEDVPVVYTLEPPPPPTIEGIEVKERSTPRVKTGRVEGITGRLTKERERERASTVSATRPALCAATAGWVSLMTSNSTVNEDRTVHEQTETSNMGTTQRDGSEAYIMICPVIWLVKYAMEAHDPPPHS